MGMRYAVREAATVELEIYPESKYCYKGTECVRKKFSGAELATFEVVEGSKARMMAEIMGLDYSTEILVLVFKDGHTEVYNNSYVDMFLY